MICCNKYHITGVIILGSGGLKVITSHDDRTQTSSSFAGICHYLQNNLHQCQPLNFPVDSEKAQPWGRNGSRVQKHIYRGRTWSKLRLLWEDVPVMIRWNRLLDFLKLLENIYKGGPPRHVSRPALFRQSGPSERDCIKISWITQNLRCLGSRNMIKVNWKKMHGYWQRIWYSNCREIAIEAPRWWWAQC